MRPDELRWALGWTLVRTLWLGGGVWLAAAVARRLLRSAGPGARYAAALAFLGALCATPALVLAA